VQTKSTDDDDDDDDDDFFPDIGAHKYDIEHKLLHDLFNKYLKDARPVLNKSEAVEVKFDMAYAQLINLVGFSH
jgi:hypothetical protein